MSSAKDIAKGFTISGLLDDASRTRKSYPVFEIDLAAIEDHPGNSVYSMDETAIAKLAESIRERGLTDLPLVRKLESGAYQMVSGHRRKAAYTLLAAADPAFVYCQALADKIGVMISTLSAFCVPTAFPTSEICQA